VEEAGSSLPFGKKLGFPMLHIGKGLAMLSAATLLGGFVLPAAADDTGAPQTAATPPAHAAHHRPVKKKAPPPLVLPPLPAGPLQQVPLPQIPESAPTVTLENGKLTIVAQNATLGDILKQVQTLTGASIDVPPNGAQERVVTQLGPGAPRDVLATLLNGTAFNYVMLGSSSDPSAVASVVLTPKPGQSAGGQTAQNNFPQSPQGMVQVVPVPGQPFRQQVVNAMPPQPEPAAAEEDNSDDSEDKDQDPDAEQPAQPDNNAQPGQPNPNQPNAGPRTPEQLLQMMRQGQMPTPPGVPPQQQPQQ